MYVDQLRFQTLRDAGWLVLEHFAGAGHEWISVRSMIRRYDVFIFVCFMSVFMYVRMYVCIYVCIYAYACRHVDTCCAG
jgi:hypothetical protein